MFKCRLNYLCCALLSLSIRENNMFIKLAFGLVIGSATIGTLAQTITDIQAQRGNSAYAQNGSNVIVRNPYGLCWRSGYWTPSDAVPGCDGQLAPPVAKITAPAVPALPSSAPAPSVVADAAPKRCDFTATLENDQTFAFDKAVLSHAAKRRIDEEVVRKLTTCGSIENVMITGHTDRIGLPPYNQKLSEQRAGAVARYLKSKNIAPVMRTVGAGSTQPINICGDVHGRQKLIDCLAPNRRVTIEVKGTAN
jgi:OOP family OmpA-OmpF porin